MASREEAGRRDLRGPLCGAVLLPFLVVCSALLSGVGPAQAQAGSNASKGSGSEPESLHGVGVELALTARQQLRAEQWAVSPRIYGHYGLSRRWRIELDWGAVLLADVPERGGGATTFGAGNPLLGLRYRVADGPSTGLSLALSATAPVAAQGNDSQAGQRRAGLGLALGMRGMWDPWLWGPGQTGLVVSGVLEHELAPQTLLTLEPALGSTVSVSDATEQDIYLYAQLGLQIRQSLGPHVQLGLRAQAVAVNADADGVQLSVVPLLCVRPGSGALCLHGVVNLDPPLGVLGNGLDVWGVGLSFESQL